MILRNFLFSLLLLSCYITTNGISQQLEWANSVGNSQSDQSNGVAIDNSGNTISVGRFQGTVDLDPGGGTSFFSTSGGTDSDGFVYKVDADGDYQWGFTIGNGQLGAGSFGADAVNAVEVDALGNIYITGLFTGIVDFDPSSGTTNLTSTCFFCTVPGSEVYSADAFWAKYDPNGNLITAFSWGSTNYEQGLDIKVSSTGGIYIIGQYEQTVDFDPGGSIQNGTSNGGHDIFIVHYNAANQFQNLLTFGSNETTIFTDNGTGIDVDASGNIYVTGFYTGTMNLNPKGSAFNISAGSSSDGFLAKYNPSGILQWGFDLGSGATDKINDCALDNLGNAYITGEFTGNVDFDPGASSQILSSANLGNADIFVAKYGNDGSYDWAFRIGSVLSSETGNSITINDASIFVGGKFATSANFNPSGSNVITSNGGINGFIASYDFSGGYRWAGGIITSNTSGSEVLAIDVNSNDEIAAGGLFAGTADFDIESGSLDLISAGNIDAFSSKYISLCVPTSITPDVANLPDLVQPCSGTPPSPTATTNCGIALTATANLSFPIYLVGESIVTWTYNDGNGNTFSHDQTLTIVGTDTDADGVCDEGDTDDDNDGCLDIDDPNPLIPSPDTDGDGTADECDLDDDNDGCLDIDDPNPLIPSPDTDGDGTADECDLDDDNDGCLDIDDPNPLIPSPDTDGDGTADECDLDDDNDGCLDIDDPNPLIPSPDTDGDGTADECDLDDDNDGCLDIDDPNPLIPSPDTDGDGTADECDLDDDNDGIEDGEDLDSLNPMVCIDADGDGCDDCSIGTDGFGPLPDNIGDVIPPTPINTSLPEIISECKILSIDTPIATDDCAGIISGVTSTTFPITNSTNIIWTYDDGKGNTATQNQIVTIEDLTSPIPDLTDLPDLFAQCIFNSLISPTSTDNCNGEIIGTTNTSFPIATPGETTIIWTYEDTSGNITTQSQTLSIQGNFDSTVNESLCEGAAFTFPDGTVWTGQTSQVSTLTSQQGCDSLITTNITILSLPEVDLGEDTVFGCLDEELSFGIDESSVNFETYTISTLLGNSSTDGPLTFTFDQTFASIASTQDVFVAIELTGANGCVGTDQTLLKDNTMINWSIGSIQNNDPSIVISSTILPETSDSFLWDFGDGNTNNIDVNPTHTYTANGDYTVTLTVSNECGDELLSTEVSITAIEDEEVISGLSDPNLIIVYPNPTSKFLFLGNDKTITAKLFDLHGHVITDTVVREGGLLDISSLTPGQYILHLYDGNRLLEIEKIIKTN